MGTAMILILIMLIIIETILGVLIARDLGLFI